MESKVFIDISYASRDPQIMLLQKDSDDPRDKLIAMLTGQAMPGVRDGYCRIERYPDEQKGYNVSVITPLHPTEVIKHIPSMRELVENNHCIDKEDFSEQYRKIILSEAALIKGATPHPLEYADSWAQNNMKPDMYKKWRDEVFYDK